MPPEAFKIVRANQARYPMVTMCRVLGGLTQRLLRVAEAVYEVQSHCQIRRAPTNFFHRVNLRAVGSEPVPCWVISPKVTAQAGGFPFLTPSRHRTRQLRAYLNCYNCRRYHRGIGGLTSLQRLVQLHVTNVPASHSLARSRLSE